MKRMRHWIASAFAMIMGLVLSFGQVQASMNIAEDIDLYQPSVITVYFSVPDIEFELYKVFDVNPDSSLKVSEQFKTLEGTVDFSKTSTESESAELAQTLDDYAQLDDFVCDYKAKVSKDGVAVFDGVMPGVYLMKSESRMYETRKFVSQPVLFYAPKEDLEHMEWSYDFELHPKFESKLALKDPLKVIKVWEDNDDEKKVRPKEITVALYLDGNHI